MSLTPVSREHLRSLKKNKDEEMRLNQINNYVRNIYSAAVYKAETTTDTFSLDPLADVNSLYVGQVVQFVPTNFTTAVHP